MYLKKKLNYLSQPLDFTNFSILPAYIVSVMKFIETVYFYMDIDSKMITKYVNIIIKADCVITISRTYNDLLFQ